VAGRGQVQPGAARLERQDQGARPLALLERGDHPVPGAPGQAAVVAVDRPGRPGRQVVGQALAPFGEVGEDQHLLPGREHRVHDLLQPGQLARAAHERLAVVLVGGGMVADLLQGGDGGQDVALAALVVAGGDQAVDHRLVEADLLGGHGAVVELVDLVGQLGRDLGLGLGAAEHEDAVEGPEGVLATGAPLLGGGRQLGDERGPGPQQARVGEVQDRPQVAQAVLDGRAGEGDAAAGRDAAQLLGHVAGRVLDGLGLVEDDPGPLEVAQGVDVAHGRAVRRDDHVGPPGLCRQLVGRRPGRAVVDDDAQAGREAGRLGRPVPDHRGRGDDQGRPAGGSRLGRPGGDAGQVGQHGRRLAQPHVQGQAAPEAAGVEERQPGQGLGLVAAQGPDEAGGVGDGLGGHRPGAGQQVGGPSRAPHAGAPRQRGLLEADRVAQHLGAGEAGPGRPLGQGGGRLVEVDPVDLDPAAPRVDQGPGVGGEAADVVGGELHVVEHRRPADVGQLVGADHRRVHGLGRQAQRRTGLAARQRRHPHVEAGCAEGRAGHPHELEGLVLAEHHLAPALAARAVQDGQEPLQADRLVGQVALRPAVDQGDLERHQPAVLAGPEH
jgi:hypothetical protein